MSKHRVGDIQFVECPYCMKGEKNRFKMLHWTHLKMHGKKLEDLLVEFPEIPTMTLAAYEVKKATARQGTIASKDTVNNMKIVKCIHCQTSMEVRNNESNKRACEECLGKGLENPDGRTKPQAEDRRKETNLERHGVENVQHSQEFKDKAATTTRERYGGIGFESPELAEKTRDVIEERYGVRNIMLSEGGVRRNIESFKKKYGENITNPLHILEIVKKVSKTKREYYKNNDHHHKGKTYEEMYGQEKAKELKEQLRISGAAAYKLAPQTSAPQLELFELVKEIFPEAICEYEKCSYFIDIAISEYKIAIEYDGSYWHDEEHDKIRDKTLDGLGWTTIRYVDRIPSKEELLEDINKVI